MFMFKEVVFFLISLKHRLFIPEFHISFYYQIFLKADILLKTQSDGFQMMGEKRMTFRMESS